MLYCLKALIRLSQYRQNLLSHLGLAFEGNLALNYEAKGKGLESGIHAFQFAVVSHVVNEYVKISYFNFNKWQYSQVSM